MIGGVLKCVKRMVLKTIRAVKRRVGWNPTPTAYEYRRNFNLDKRSNIRLICPNCDSQTDTFKSKNKNSTRRNYYREKILKQSK